MVTKKGNPSYAAEVIEAMDHPVAKMIQEWRSANKRVSTYYSSFDYYGQTGRVHADAIQHGAATGRMSYREPNLQNVPKTDENNLEASQVRRCFLPETGQCLFMPDYNQMEYRMMVD